MLTGYQILRLAMGEATDSSPTTNADRASFTVALHAARDQIIHAAAVIADASIDLVGVIGRTILADLLPDRGPRVCPRVVNARSPNTEPKAPSTAPTTTPRSPPRSPARDH